MDATRGFLRQVIDINPHFIFVKDREGRFTLVNEAIAEAYGTTVEGLIGKTDADFNSNAAEVDHFRRADLEVMDTQREMLIPLEVITDSKGKVRYLQTIKRPLVDPDGVARHVLGVATDITTLKQTDDARRALESQMLQAQKLESLGLLAGGVAHDFNNLLVGVLTNADVAMRKLGPGSSAIGSLEQIHLAAMRAAELCRQMLAYAGRGEITIESVDVTAVVDELAQLMRASISKNAMLGTDFASHLPPIAADPTQLRQIVMNLITNASDALEGHEGTITVSTGIRELTHRQLEEDCTKQPPRPGRYVHIEVTDTGHGMTPATIARMFDPFYSTKVAGRGLGLAAVLGIVRTHHGAIFVRSIPGAGSTCSVHFPVDAVEEPAVEPPANKHVQILVVDDEPIVIAAIKEMLELDGYAVTTAHGGQEAIDLFRAKPDSFAGVILDMTMPRLAGVDVMHQLRTIRPDVRIILMSGYERSRAAQLDQQPTAFLQKPFRSEDLLDAVAKLRD
jgi:two-component system, cell cycle sensor histidine kinase and response regulator CckA